MGKLTIAEALNQALHQEMEKDESVVVLGEDVGVDGGVFRITDGLIKKYGEKRVMDTPLAESAILGTSVGMAMMGLKPVCEMQFDGFSYPALDHMFNHAARIRNRTRGRQECPLVMRFPYGGGVRALEHHSEAPDTYYAHTPGLKVVIPSTPYDAKGLLISSIRDPDPVVFMEPKRIYRAFKEDVPEEEYTVELGKAKVAREGSDLTIISYGAMMRQALEAATELQQENINAEVIDLRTLMPFDVDAILNSVKKTGKCVVVHEAPRTLGMASEIMAQIMEKAMLELKAPVARVTGFDTTMPYFQTEQSYLPNVQRILKAVKEMQEF